MSAIPSSSPSVRSHLSKPDINYLASCSYSARWRQNLSRARTKQIPAEDQRNPHKYKSEGLLRGHVHERRTTQYGGEVEEERGGTVRGVYG